MTIRKKFIFDKETARYLEEIAKKENITQTDIIKNLIKEKYQEYSIQEKIEAFNSIAGSCPGMFVGKSIQSIKAEMGAEI